MQEALSAVNLAKSFYERQRNDQAFKSCYDKAVCTAQELQIEEPKLPRYRRAPRRLDQGSRPHQFTTPMEHFHQQYNEACDLLIGELNDRFEQQNLLPPVLALESVLLNAANGLNYQDQLTVVQQSCYKDDFNFSRLESQLGMLTDAIKVALPSVRKVLSVRTINFCDVMNAQTVYKIMRSEVHKQLRLYLTAPITTATSERTFSALRHVLPYLKSTMTEKRLNNCLLLYVHKELTDSLGLLKIGRDFINNEERRKHFGLFE